jgi:hypothetical protein
MDYRDGMPHAEVDNFFLRGRLNEGSLNVAMHVETDPVSGVDIFGLFTDDGHGNGECLLLLPLAELRNAVADYSRRRTLSGRDCG